MNIEQVFTSEYFEAQLSKYQNLQEKEIGSVKFIYQDICGRLDGYLYKSFESIEKVPMLLINGQTWMSLTPMEIQSHVVAIKKAHGVVGVAGLGFGYYIQEILQKNDVESIDVYEINQDVIDMYISNFGNNSKVNIIKANVLEMEDKEYDFFYADIYPTQMDLDALKHKALLTSSNSIGEYFFWTQEAIVYTLLLSEVETYGLNDSMISDLLTALLDEKEDYLIDTRLCVDDVINALEDSQILSY